MALFGIALVRPGRDGRWLPGVALLGFAGWLLSAPQGRYLVAWVPVMCLAVTGVVGFLTGTGLRRQLAALAVVLGVGVHQMYAQEVRFAPHWSALASRRESVQQTPGYDLCAALNEIVPPGGRIVGLWENRFFFLQREFTADAVWQVPAMLAQLRRLDDPGRFATELRDAGYTHVVLRRAGMESYFANHYAYDLTDPVRYPPAQYARDRVLMTRFLSEQLEPIAEHGPYWIYRLRGATAAH
jgi:hypothetical protein